MKQETTRPSGSRRGPARPRRAGLALGALVLILSSGPARARRAVLLPCADRTGTTLGQRATDAMGRELRALGIELLHGSHPAGPDRRQKVTGFIRSAAWRDRRAYKLKFVLADPQGRPLSRHLLRLKRPRPPLGRIRRMARLFSARLAGEPASHPASSPVAEGGRTQALQPEPPAPARPRVQRALEPGAAASDPGSQDRLVAEITLHTLLTDNVFFNRSTRSDLVLQPATKLAVDFGSAWSVGYNGEVNLPREHTELRSQWHEAYLFFNPAWGEAGQHELVVEGSLGLLRNQGDFSPLDYVQARLRLQLGLTPARWLHWGVWSTVAYRHFDWDPASSSLDTWAGGYATFALGDRTWLTPRVKGGLRHYPEPATGIDRDLQLELGLHLVQALWSQAGLELDYAWVRAVGDSGMIERLVNQQQAVYLGWDFLYSGHQARMGFKQVLGEHFSLGGALDLSQRTYAGWPAFDASGAPSGQARLDRLLSASAFCGFAWKIGPGDRAGGQARLGLHFEYRYTRQWSNSHWFDTRAHSAILAAWAAY